MVTAPLPTGEFEELAILIRGHHALIHLDARELTRVSRLLHSLTAEFDMPYFEWAPGAGLKRGDQAMAVYGTEPLNQALAHIASSNVVALYHFNMAGGSLDEPRTIALLHRLSELFSQHSGALVFTFVDSLPKEVDAALARVELKGPSAKEYYEYLSGIVKDIQSRQRVAVRLNKAQLLELLGHLKGLTLMDVRRLITAAIIERGALDEETIRRVIDAKARSFGQSPGLEYFPAESDFKGIAGMRRLRSWLDKRRPLFADPGRAKKYGLTPPRGLLLLGVQGCGKSTAAKAVATAFRLPLLRLDAGGLYDKYVGGTEKNLGQALSTAERLAPVVLWVDEIEKALSRGGDSDGGTSQRVLGTFLTWLAESQAGVFVVATANDVTRLPPELLRKGRFDEIFFVDLPSTEIRQEVFSVHLSRRGRDPAQFDLERLGAASDGFSGGEIEQAVVSALFSAFNAGSELNTELLLAELQDTRPLSIIMGEQVQALRAWAAARTVAAD